VTTLDAYARVLAGRVGRAAPEPEHGLELMYDVLQHQGVTKRAAYESEAAARYVRSRLRRDPGYGRRRASS
jgi:hypothetical protein